MEDIGLVILDCDGVLVDSEPIAARVAAKTMSDLGFTVTAEEMSTWYAGLSADAVTQSLEALYNLKAPSHVNELRRRKIMEAFVVELQPIPGVVKALKQIGLKKCVASSSHPERLALALRLTGLAPLFGNNVFSSSMVARGKPAPDLFLYAAQRMMIPPQRCVVVEDSEVGVTAAKAAGMRVFGFCGGGHCRAGHAERLIASGAHSIFERMAELPQLIGKHGS